MTSERDDRESAVGRLTATPVGAASLAAAGLAGEVIRLLEWAKRTSRMSSRELAERLQITEGRVSQVLHGDGNVHIATLARFMSALGYKIRISAEPIDPGGERSPDRAHRRRQSAPVESAPFTVAVYTQRYVSASGVHTVPLPVLVSPHGQAVPIGEPERLGEVRFEATPASGRLRQLVPVGDSWTQVATTVAANVREAAA